MIHFFFHKENTHDENEAPDTWDAFFKKSNNSSNRISKSWLITVVATSLIFVVTETILVKKTFQSHHNVTEIISINNNSLYHD
ncbi:MAG: hypothetical protein ACSHW7_10965 [Patiriisocius sp.]|uniref:hypothetical protein n=1 Tax=Patiriisocius sp. TaxID=2822396 RepID=UPI003EF81964